MINKKSLKIKNILQEKFTKYFFIVLVFLSTVNIASAQVTQSCTNVGSEGGVFKDFAQCIVDIITIGFVPYIFALTLLAFAVGILSYVKNADNESKRSESIKLIIWSLIGMFFMVTVWGFAAMFAQFWGVADAPDNLIIPQFK